ncbi:MAG: AAA family ATPase [bacterium]
MTQGLPMDAELAPAPTLSLDAARAVAEKIRARVRYDVMGRDQVIELVLVALFGDGHLLLEDYPGSGKTTLAKALGTAIIDDRPDEGLPTFRRVQFTPDMLPGDVTGVMIFDSTSNDFHFRPGPVFTHILLVDEINRTSPKVQAALLECMAEKQVTVDNLSHRLDDLFFVMATQNPLDSVGTYPCPSPSSTASCSRCGWCTSTAPRSCRSWRAGGAARPLRPAPGHPRRHHGGPRRPARAGGGLAAGA